MLYVDGFVAAVHTANKAAFVEHVQTMAAVFKEYGALSVVNCWGDDVPPGKLTSFPLAVQCQEGETVVFSWTTWASRQARDEGWGRMTEDPRMKPGAVQMPFDGKRVIYGGFEMISSL
jgi:uncharacterized protein YbaA (DUF1428 family)